MDAVHAMHATHNILEKTKIGHQVTAGVASAAIGLVHAVGGTAAAGVAVAFAPVVVPLALAGGAGYLASKLLKKH
jgi:hypothetical protein